MVREKWNGGTNDKETVKIQFSVNNHDPNRDGERIQGKVWTKLTLMDFKKNHCF